MPNPIDTPEYWIEDFQPSKRDLDLLYEHVLEVGRPVDIEQLASHLVRQHVDRAMEARRAREKAKGTVYQPSDRYEKGQKLIFPHLDGVEGKVEAVRAGNNPAYGDYEVIQVKLGSEQREFAAGYEQHHALSATETDLDPEAAGERYGSLVAPQLAAQLSADPEWLRYGDRWILRALLPEINEGHRNLAEAIVMLAGEPLPADQILKELDVSTDGPAETRELALELALASDARFRNVGALESPLWTLRSST
jgi:hypothetical protein